MGIDNDGIVMKRTRSMEHGSPELLETEAQKQAVFDEIGKAGQFNPAILKTEIDWFFGPLGLHDFYFAGTSPTVIAEHIVSLLAAKILSQTSGKDLDLQLVQETDSSAFFASRSNVHGGESSERKRVPTTETGPSHSELLERKIEENYLNGGTNCIGDGVSTGYESLITTTASKPRQFRLQCYRSSGVLDATMSPYHMRMYFLQKPDFVDPNPGPGPAEIQKLADKTFLQRAGPNLIAIYEKIVNQAAKQMTPVVHTEVWTEQDGRKMARFAIAHKVGATHSYFASIADVYRAHGLFSTRKYVEFFSNDVVVYGFYLQQLDGACRGCGSFEERIKSCVTDASLHFVLPRTSLTPMLRDNLLSPTEISYAYAAWKFTFHFLHRLPEGYETIAKSLREKDQSAFARLEKLRNAMKFNTFTESQILEAILASSNVVKTLYEDFYQLHCVGSSRQVAQEQLLLNLKKNCSSDQNFQIFSMFVSFNRHLLRTNFFKENKVALSFRFDGSFLSDIEFAEKPYAIIFVIGSEFRGFHVRFLDIARGGIRMIRSPYAQAYGRNVSSLFDECYSLASTQQRKNKDIPEGGSKGVILLNMAHQDKDKVAFKKYIDAITDIMLPAPDAIDKYRKEEILFLGPDEGTADLMDWASSHAHSRGYRYWKAFTTGKSPTRGGIPHDVYGMTTHSVRAYVTGIQSKLKLQENGRITKVQTGGPDGDLGSNEILMSVQEDTIAIVDGSGVLYDPSGICRPELLRLAKARSPVSGFKRTKLSKEGFYVGIDETEVTLPNGHIVENGTQLRNTFHLNPLLHADFFVPCGGRPSAVNLSNVETFMYRPNSRDLRFKYIVEGANLFITQDARLVLESAGVLVFKDASANKGGVTSSSLEVMAALVMTDDEFARHMQVDPKTGSKPEFYESYVKDVQNQIDLNASREFECLWEEHQRCLKPLCVLSNELSEKITELTIRIQGSKLWDNENLRTQLISSAIPKALNQLLGLETILQRLPETYTRALFASQLASRFVYSAGLNTPEFAFYEFVEEYLHA